MMPKDRVEMLQQLGLAGKDCAEIGVFDGWYAEHILACSPSRLLLVDPWMHQDSELYASDQANVSDSKFASLFDEVSSKFGGDPRVVIARALSYDYAPKVPYESLDFVYIDAMHSFEGCFSDMLVWYQKVKPGGWMCGHDYTGKFLGVRYAVDAFLKLTNTKLQFVTSERWASWGMQK